MDKRICNAINKALFAKIPFFAYRLPCGSEICFGAQVSKGIITGNGFKIMPFDETQGCAKRKIIYSEFTAAEFLAKDLFARSYPSGKFGQLFQTTDKHRYEQEFKQCFDLLQSKALDKIVLSKRLVCTEPNVNWGEFFEEMTAAYPTAFVFIYYSAETGAWTGATPETLGSYKNEEFRTMALAGTKKTDDYEWWSQKEIKEQEFVVSYIKNVFKENGIDYTLFPKEEKTAGCVKHLCNVFAATIQDVNIAEKLIGCLHPTPAVSGIPKTEAMRAINRIEETPRLYYAGYIGPFSTVEKTFEYFVNLRSLCFDNTYQVLFSGGGITVDSQMRQEWEETEEKAKTLMPLLKKRKF